MGGIQRYPGGGGYGAAAQGRLPPLLRDRRSASPDAASRFPTTNCYCEIDPAVKDQYGIPVLRFHWKWTRPRDNQVKHMQETFRALIAEMGGEVFVADAHEGAGLRHRERRLDHPRTGHACAWAATRRRRRSTRDCQARDCKNLFVADGGPFVIAGGQESRRGRSSRSPGARGLHHAAAEGGGAMKTDGRWRQESTDDRRQTTDESRRTTEAGRSRGRIAATW